MRNTFVVAAIAACSLASPAVAADTITFNGMPAEGWQYGAGNNYAPSNTAVLTTDTGSQLSLRLHTPGNVAAPSDASGVYTFALGTPAFNFDFGLDQALTPYGVGDLTNPLVTLTNLLTGQTTSFNPLLLPDNWQGTGANFGDIQNSERTSFGFLSGLGYDPSINNTYSVNLSAGGRSLTTYAQIGAGAGAVPEPATWVMMLVGFGGIGFQMRRKRPQMPAQIA
jgi:hypothetical protein